jgi:hypothetical protein
MANEHGKAQCNNFHITCGGHEDSISIDQHDDQDQIRIEKLCRQCQDVL